MNHTNNTSYKTDGIAKIWRDIANSAKENSNKDGYKPWVHAAKSYVKHYNKCSEQASDANTEFLIANFLYNNSDQDLQIIAKNLDINLPEDLERPKDNIVNSAIKDKFMIEIYEQKKLNETKNKTLLNIRDFDLEELEQDAREEMYRSIQSAYNFFTSFFNFNATNPGFTDRIQQERERAGRNL